MSIKSNCRSTILFMVSFIMVGFPAILMADHQWGRYAWKGSSPEIAVVNNMTTDNWDDHFNTVMSDWNSSSVLTLTSSEGTMLTCDPVFDTIQVCNVYEEASGWLGIAQIWAIKGKQIVQATAKMNDYYLNNGGGYYDSDAWRLLVACQEVGHDFGLDHQDENFNNTPLGTCMDYTSGPLFYADLHPNDHDYEQLLLMYGGGTDDGGSSDKSCNPKSPKCNPGATPAPPPQAMNDIAFEGPAQWGRLMSRSANGHQEVYELDFGHGYKVLTHVTWVESQGPEITTEEH